MFGNLKVTKHIRLFIKIREFITQYTIFHHCKFNPDKIQGKIKYIVLVNCK